MRPGLNLAISTVRAWNNIGRHPRIVAPANASRTQIVFHNPGCVDILVAPVIVVHDPHERDDCRPDHDRPHWGEQLPDQWREHHREIPLQRPPVPVGNRPLHPGPHRRGGCLLVYGNGGDLPISGNVTMAWQAFAVEGGDHPLTVIELT